MRLPPFADAPALGGWKGLVHRRLSMGVRVVLTIAGWAGSGEWAAGCGRCKWPPRLDFAQFKRRKQGNRQAGGTERPVLSVYQGRRRTVKTLGRQPQVAAHQSDASTKVGGGLAYQAAVRWAEGRCCRRRWAARVVQEKSPLRIGVVRGDLQLPAQHKPSQDLRRVRRRVGAEQGMGSEFALWVPNQDPAQGRRRLARAVPDRRLRREFHRAGSAVAPGCRHLVP